MHHSPRVYSKTSKNHKKNLVALFKFFNDDIDMSLLFSSNLEDEKKKFSEELSIYREKQDKLIEEFNES